MYVVVEQADGSVELFDTGDSIIKLEISPATTDRDPRITGSNFTNNIVMRADITGSIDVIGVTGKVLLSKTVKDLTKALGDKPPPNCFHPMVALDNWEKKSDNVDGERLQALLHNFNHGISSKLEDVYLIVTDAGNDDNHMVCCIAEKKIAQYHPLVALNDRGEVHMLVYASDEILNYMGMHRTNGVIAWSTHGNIDIHEVVMDKYQNFWIRK